MKKRIYNWLVAFEIERLWTNNATRDRRINDLEKRVEELESRNRENDRIMGELSQIVMGLMDYLDVKVEKQLEERKDILYRPPMQEVWKIVKRGKI